jgi:hypothetical protein
MYVVTTEFNLYDQEGQYFVAAFESEPTFQELKTLLPKESDVTIGKLTRGGGRENGDHQWYNLHQVQSGEFFFKENI